MAHITTCTFCGSTDSLPKSLWMLHEKSADEPVHTDCITHIASSVLKNFDVHLAHKPFFDALHVAYKGFHCTWAEFRDECGDLHTLAREIFRDVVKAVEKTCGSTLAVYSQTKGKDDLKKVFEADGEKVFKERFSHRVELTVSMILHKRRMDAFFGPGLLDYSLSDRFDEYSDQFKRESTELYGESREEAS